MLFVFASIQLIYSYYFIVHFEIIFYSSNNSLFPKALKHLLIFQYILLSYGNCIYTLSYLIPRRHKSSGGSPEFSWLISPAKYNLFKVIEIELFNNRKETQRKHTRRHLGASLTDMGLLLRILIVLEEYKFSLKGDILSSPKILVFIKIIFLFFFPVLMRL